MIELSESSCYMLLNMFDQIDELQRIKFNKFIMMPKVFDLRAFLHKLFNKMRIQAEFQCLKMFLSIESRLPRRILADQERLEKVLFVLIQNSLKYTHRGSIKLNVEAARSIPNPQLSHP